VLRYRRIPYAWSAVGSPGGAFMRGLRALHGTVLLGGPLPVRVQGEAGDADASGGVLDHGRTQAWVPSSRSTVKKSQARIASASERRNCDPVGLVPRQGGPTPLA
jgi:hypothetical protein